MTVIRWYFYCLTHCFTTSGRASRSEFWSFVLINAAVFCLLGFFGWPDSEKILTGDSFFFLYEAENTPANWFLLLTAVPFFTAAARRLHDRGHTGWWIFWGIIFFPLQSVIFLFTVLPTEKKANIYGPRPPHSPSEIVDNTPVYREDLKENSDHAR